MIDARELRIGNMTNLGVVIGIYPSSERTETQIIFDTMMVNCSSVEPIPLTEEWLIKFGFFRHHKDYANDVIYLKNVVDSKEFEWGCYPNELGSGIQINNRKLLKYVHQLQNLYHALTGTELTLK